MAWKQRGGPAWKSIPAASGVDQMLEKPRIWCPRLTFDHHRWSKLKNRHLRKVAIIQSGHPAKVNCKVIIRKCISSFPLFAKVDNICSTKYLFVPRFIHHGHHGGAGFCSISVRVDLRNHVLLQGPFRVLLKSRKNRVRSRGAETHGGRVLGELRARPAVLTQSQGTLPHICASKQRVAVPHAFVRTGFRSSSC